MKRIDHKQLLPLQCTVSKINAGVVSTEKEKIRIEFGTRFGLPPPDPPSRTTVKVQCPKSMLVLSPQKMSAPANTVRDELVPHTTNKERLKTMIPAR